MSKKDIPVSLDELDENPFVEWVNKNKSNLIYGLLILLAAIFLLYRFMSGTATRNEKDFYAADNLGAKLYVAEGAKDNISKLAEIVARQPELEAKYDGLMAQTYLLLNQPQDAKPLMERNLSRIQEDAYSQSSAKISLLVGQGKLKEAYLESLKLKDSIKKANIDTVPILYLYNMYRIHSLSLQIGTKDEQKKNLAEWMDLEKRGQSVGVTPVLFSDFMQVLNVGDVSFQNYLNELQ